MIRFWNFIQKNSIMKVFKYSDNKRLDVDVKQFERFFPVRELSEINLILFIELVDSIYKDGYDDGWNAEKD
jgi:hypothetical protein